MYRKKLFFLILICTCIRLFIASTLNLGNDEVYYYTYALHMQSNYFDHPPGVAFLIRIFTFNLFFKQEVFIRLGAICCAAAGTLLSYHIGKELRNERTGWFAAILYNTSIYSSLIAGTFILPDSPQLVFWLASLFMMVHIVKLHGNKDPLNPAHWLLFGLANGLCIMCKVHGVFLWFGFGLYILCYNRSILKIPGLYLSFAITMLLISPILLWNIQNDFVTWNYHSGRVAVNHFVLDLSSFGQAIGGQLFYNNPLNVILSILAIGYFGKRRQLKSDFNPLLLFCGLPMIATVTGISLYDSVLPHWSGPAFTTLSFLAAVYLDTIFENRSFINYPRVLVASMLLTGCIITGGLAFINYYPGTIGSEKNENYGELDFTLDLRGWRSFSQRFLAWEKQAVWQKKLDPKIKIVCDKWFPAAHLDYYIARHLGTFVTGVGKVDDLHHYVWLNNYRPPLEPGDNALCIVPSNDPDNPYKTYSQTFQGVKFLQTFDQFRNGYLVRYFRIYLLTGYKGGDEASRFKIGTQF